MNNKIIDQLESILL